MIGKWLAKLYRKFNKTDQDNIYEEIDKTHVSFGKYKDASQEFKKTIVDNHFFPYLVYDKGEQKHHD